LRILKAGDGMQEKPRHPGDPRKDLATDHRLWKDLLWNCWHLQIDLYYLLHGIRCGGAELTLTQNSYRLMPGEWSESEWEDIKRKHLDPIREKLINILKLTRFGKITEETLPPGVFEDKPEFILVEQERMVG